jgi:2-polyprenyl-6-methoxyphenol hydroxylase-like FAD-dependent oxidoreductase
MAMESGMTNVKSILISGASVAGPTLAFWLKHNGFVPTIMERAPKSRPGGQAIDIRGKALDVVERMGLLNQARAKRTQMKGVSVQDEFGKEVWHSEEKTFSGGRFDNDDVELLRDDLSNLLLGQLRRHRNHLRRHDCELVGRSRRRGSALQE